MKSQAALITGGGSGIGFATAKLMLEEGARVTIVGRDMKKLEQAKKDLAEHGDRLRIASGSVGSEGFANKFIADALDAFGSLDILVNNAGVFRGGSILEMSEEDFDYNIDVNLKGTWFMCRFAARALIKSGGGAIVNVSSLLAVQGHPQVASSAYSAAKGGILGLTKALAVELAPHKVRVNAVVPAVVRTPMFENLVGKDQLQEAMEKSVKIYPIGRLGEPEDVARAIVFLARPENSWITGAQLTVDGGISAV